MSKRRVAGEVVRKKANAGFIGQASLVQIQQYETTDFVESCLMDCGDPDCREWPMAFQCDVHGKAIGGIAYHVSECQMEDAPEVAAAAALREEIRQAIATIGKGYRKTKAAASQSITNYLRRSGVKVNAHDVLKALRRPHFELTGRGWRNSLRQTALFS